MPGRLAVDFGTSNTVLALWDPDRKEASTYAPAAYRSLYPRGIAPHQWPVSNALQRRPLPVVMSDRGSAMRMNDGGIHLFLATSWPVWQQVAPAI